MLFFVTSKRMCDEDPLILNCNKSDRVVNGCLFTFPRGECLRENRLSGGLSVSLEEKSN